MELKIVKGPNKGKLVVLVGKYDETRVLVKDYSNNMIYPINSSYVKEVQHNQTKKLTTLNRNVQNVQKIESEQYVGVESNSLQQPVHIASEEFIEYPSEEIEPISEQKSELYKIGYDNMKHIEIVTNIQLLPLEKKFFLFIRSFFDILYSGIKNVDDSAILAKKIAGIAEKNNIPPNKYKFFTAILFYILIKQKDLRVPDTFVVKFNREFFLDYLKGHSNLKISNGSIQEYTKLITEELYPKKELTKVKSVQQEKRLDNLLDSLVQKVENNPKLTKKQKDILFKVIPLFPTKDFSKNINPLVKDLYLEYLK